MSVIALFRWDLKRGLRDAVILYMLILPLLLAVVLRFFAPGLADPSLSFVLVDGDPRAASLQVYGRVLQVPDEEALYQRVLARDDSIGVWGEGLVIQGDEPQASLQMAQAALAQIGSVYPIDVVRGEGESPILPLLGLLLALVSIYIGGVVMALQMVEDREAGTQGALAVTPLSAREYILGRGLLGMSLGLILALGSLMISGQWAHGGEVFLLLLGGAMASLVLGTIIGSTSPNQLAAIGQIKVASLLFLALPMARHILPGGWERVLFPLPTYWTLRGLEGVLLRGEGLGAVLIGGLGAALTSLILLGLSWSLLKRSLGFKVLMRG